jgi:serine/threonine protein phosphatase 1
MEQIYIISDVHGCYKSLLALIEQFPNKQKSKICFVGDLIDRGINSFEVIEFVKNNNYACVMGSHEKALLQYSEFGVSEDLKKWYEKGGGKETINSYSSKEKFNEHIEYLKSLPLYLEYQDYRTIDDRYLVVSHSAVADSWNLRLSLNAEDKRIFEQYCLYKRYKQFDNKDIFNIYGHAVRSEVKITSFDCNIDLGCCYKGTNDAISNPRLCALEFPSMKIYIQENKEIYDE